VFIENFQSSLHENGDKFTDATTTMRCPFCLDISCLLQLHSFLHFLPMRYVFGPNGVNSRKVLLSTHGNREFHSDPEVAANDVASDASLLHFKGFKVRRDCSSINSIYADSSPYRPEPFVYDYRTSSLCSRLVYRANPCRIT